MFVTGSVQYPLYTERLILYIVMYPRASSRLNVSHDTDKVYSLSLLPVTVTLPVGPIISIVLTMTNVNDLLSSTV